MITQEELQKLRDMLPYDYAEIIEHRTGFSKSSIYKNLAGERYNQKIIDAAIILAKEIEADKQKAKAEIANL